MLCGPIRGPDQGITTMLYTQQERVLVDMLAAHGQPGFAETLDYLAELIAELDDADELTRLDRETLASANQMVCELIRQAHAALATI